jgi:hypothetical protein
MCEDISQRKANAKNCRLRFNRKLYTVTLYIFCAGGQYERADDFPQNIFPITSPKNALVAGP